MPVAYTCTWASRDVEALRKQFAEIIFALGGMLGFDLLISRPAGLK